jgi:hypothetical protein
MREKVARHYKKARTYMRARKLPFALFIAIGATLLLTLISLTIYKVGGFYRYDLSRPGFEKERAEISTSPNDASFNTTSPLSQQGVEEFLKPLDQHRKNFDTYNAFGNGGLSDEDLRLSEQTPSSAPQ